MSRAIIVVLVVGIVSLSAAALWIVLPRGAALDTVDPTPSTVDDAERRQRAEKFFGGDPDRDVRGGQEMKPRW
ncbi:entry exclusion protein TrbK [Aminobacter aminovorans]|uniref:Entry-exclusion protein n=1 Tax=Aminobacter aminovorans TaxID=83263 RepID=A0AAC8YW07_AMIAI|nr:entry exclusion protein TrbK [Aminobacter aminovorans]AMS45440.1 Entry-exclusion protein [Aminobacter aminovorans]MBB3708642.1 Ti type entry exclusion protein TrbK [Aminobacter aminovorans]